MKKKINTKIHFELTKTQNNALELLKKGESVFITGEAGTGKSFLLNTFINLLRSNKKKYMITAPTGIGAINVGGATLHRTFGIKIGIVEPNIEIPFIPTLENIDVLIVDEISMARIDIFEYVVRCIEKVNESRKKKIQIVLVGDFYQLPPVIKKDEYKIFKELFPYVKKGYPFESPLWESLKLKVIKLKEIVRQGDPELIENLNKARIGDKSCIEYFNNKSKKRTIKDAITLCPTNSDVDVINTKEVNKINSKTYYYEAFETGIIKQNEKPTNDVIALKKGVRVMCLINEKDLLYQNGSLGKVVSCSNDEVVVEFDDGVIETFTPYKWEVKKYGVKKESDKKSVIEEVIGSFTQIPLKVAYAISIHKSQGQTFEKVNLIPSCFADGQLYVALSRVKSIDGLHLVKKIKASDLKADKGVTDFYD